MREIKFRAWSELQKAMFTDLDIEKLYMLGGSEDVNIIELALKYDFKNLQWEQFTGLYDKNGKEIYEGDIFHPEYNRFGNYVVEYRDGEFNVSRYDLNKTVILGNIHENPELLK